MEDHETFCVLPFVAMHVNPSGGLRPCCQFDNQAITTYFQDWPQWRNQGLDDLRHNLMSGIRDPRCQVCWQQEDSRAPSHRVRHNRLYQKDLQEIMQNPKAGADRPLRMLHLDFDNLCNLRCIMCSPTLSSSLQTEIFSNLNEWQIWQPSVKKAPKPWHETEMFSHLLQQMDTVEEIFITGGEPLMNPNALRLLEQVDLSNKTLTVTTNGTKVSPQILSLLSRAGDLHVMISLEGVGAHNDYVRAGSEWAAVQSNIDRLRTLKNFKYGDIAINHTLQITSAWTLPGLTKWCLDHALELTVNPLINPRQLHVSGMEDAWRMALITQLTDMIQTPAGKTSKTFAWIDSTIRYLGQVTHDPAITKLFWEYVAMLDRVRGTHFDQTFVPLQIQSD